MVGFGVKQQQIAVELHRVDFARNPQIRCSHHFGVTHFPHCHGVCPLTTPRGDDRILWYLQRRQLGVPKVSRCRGKEVFENELVYIRSTSGLHPVYIRSTSGRTKRKGRYGTLPWEL